MTTIYDPAPEACRHCCQPWRAHIGSTGACPTGDLEKPSALVEFFRNEAPEWGDKGDYENWPPERTAIEMIRLLRRELAARRGAA